MAKEIYQGLMEPRDMDHAAKEQGYQARCGALSGTTEHHMARELYRHAAVKYVTLRQYGDAGTEGKWMELCHSLSVCFPGVEK